jgi:DNA-binding HxlR family transcriptional regulator
MRLKDKEVVIKLNGQTYHCAMDVTMNFIGGKWKTVVLWYLKTGEKRFTALHKLIPQITERMLSITLKQLHEDNLVIRKVITAKPPLKIEYSLSEFGKSLIPVLNAVAKWGRDLSTEKGNIVEA